MTATAQQKKFNQYPSRPFKPDLWHRHSKDEKRENARALIYGYLIAGGEIKRAPPMKVRGGGRAKIFTKDAPKSASYDRGVALYLSGHDFTTSGPRWTAKAVREDSATKRDAVNRVGAAHADFAGAVIQIGNKLVPRQVGSRGRHLEQKDATGVYREAKIVDQDSADGIADARGRAAIKDDMNMNAVDLEHFERFKLAA